MVGERFTAKYKATVDENGETVNHDTVKEDIVERKKQGYSNISDTILECGDCGKMLVVIKKVKDTPDEHKFKAMCDYCGGSSFIKSVSGKVYIASSENTNLVDIKHDKVTVIYVKVKE